MNENINKILWVDDEIDLLESHIIYLMDRGYEVHKANSGEDAIEFCKNNKIDLVLLDEMMTGIDGMTTLKKIKEINIDLPIIMVTKNEEEMFMEEALAEQIAYYLTKPVNPSQILMACKKVLDNKQISSDKLIKDFLNFIQNTQQLNYNNLEFDDWKKLFNELCDWSIKTDQMSNTNFKNILNDEKDIINKCFSKYIISNYKSWLNNPLNRPMLSCDLFNNIFKPIINKNKLIIIIIDCFRFDQWKQISSLLKDDFDINEDIHVSILPTATPFARNAIFSGMLPLEIKQSYRNLWDKMFLKEKYNSYEDQLLKKILKKNNLENKSLHYEKIFDHSEGSKFYNRLSDYKNIDVLSIVVNFVDILGHSRSESNVLKELIPNESAYRLAVSNWFNNSWLKDCLTEFSNWGADIIITSDHGNTIVTKPSKVKADNTVSQGVRYKYGRNLNIDTKDVFKIENPKEYFLPNFDVNTQYILAKEKKFFVYHNQYNKYTQILKDSFQHGGISLEEMFVPLIHLKSK